MSFASHLNTNSITAREPLRFLPSPPLLALPRLFPSLPLPSCILPLAGWTGCRTAAQPHWIQPGPRSPPIGCRRERSQSREGGGQILSRCWEELAAGFPSTPDPSCLHSPSIPQTCRLLRLPPATERGGGGKQAQC